MSTGVVLSGCGGIPGAAGANATGDESLLDLIDFDRYDEPQELIDAALNEYNADDRARGIAGMAVQPFGADPVFVNLYRGGVTDPDAAVRAASARALGLHGSPGDAVLLAGLLGDEDRLVRWNAARSLQRVHSPAVVPALLGAVDERREAEADVRVAAAEALGQYAEERVLQGLIAALDDTSFSVNHAALGSLRTLTGEGLDSRPATWLVWLEGEDSPFEGRRAYRYPAFDRDTRWFEWVNPFYEVPRETAERPVGMPAVANEPGG